MNIILQQEAHNSVFFQTTHEKWLNNCENFDDNNDNNNEFSEFTHDFVNFDTL